MLRIALFLGTNMAVLVVFAIISKVFGLDRMMAANGMNYISLLVFATLMGFAGSIISLLTSKFMAKRSMGVHVIDPDQPSNSTEVWLLQTVYQQAQQAGIGRPEVGIFESPEPNAFATGSNRNNALVAVSTGLLSRMQRGEVEAVLGHEVSHVANGDMITMTLLQGVLNTFVIFLSRVIGSLVDNAMSKNQSESRGPGIGAFFVTMVLQVVFGMIANMIVMWFSRRREFYADAGGAALSSPQNMIAALERLQQAQEQALQAHQQPSLPKQLAAFGISGGMSSLFSSHPPLAVRIAALREAQRHGNPQ